MKRIIILTVAMIFIATSSSFARFFGIGTATPEIPPVSTTGVVGPGPGCYDGSYRENASSSSVVEVKYCIQVYVLPKQEEDSGLFDTLSKKIYGSKKEFPLEWKLNIFESNGDLLYSGSGFTSSHFRDDVNTDLVISSINGKFNVKRIQYKDGISVEDGNSVGEFNADMNFETDFDIVVNDDKSASFPKRDKQDITYPEKYECFTASIGGNSYDLIAVYVEGDKEESKRLHGRYDGAYTLENALSASYSRLHGIAIATAGKAGLTFLARKVVDSSSKFVDSSRGIFQLLSDNSFALIDCSGGDLSSNCVWILNFGSFVPREHGCRNVPAIISLDFMRESTR
jgi:hypothetical protein